MFPRKRYNIRLHGAILVISYQVESHIKMCNGLIVYLPTDKTEVNDYIIVNYFKRVFFDD